MVRSSRFRVRVVVLVAMVVLLWAKAVAATEDVRAGSVRLAHGDVQYELAGQPSSGDLVVLVSGYSVPMSMWNATAPRLRANGFSVLRFDLYGRGGSARPRVDYTVDLFADQLWQLVTLKELQLPATFHVVASSMGGPVIARFANRHPGVIRRLVLVSPAGFPVAAPAVTTLLKVPLLGDALFHVRFRELMTDHLHDNLAGHVCHYPRVLADFRRQLEVPGTADAMLSTLRHTLLQDFSEEFRRLGRQGLPTLSVWGNRDILVPPDTDDRLREAIPQLVQHRIRDAGHLPQLERPELFARRVIGFLGQ